MESVASGTVELLVQKSSTLWDGTKRLIIDWSISNGTTAAIQWQAYRLLVVELNRSPCPFQKGKVFQTRGRGRFLQVTLALEVVGTIFFFLSTCQPKCTRGSYKVEICAMRNSDANQKLYFTLNKNGFHHGRLPMAMAIMPWWYGPGMQPPTTLQLYISAGTSNDSPWLVGYQWLNALNR